MSTVVTDVKNALPARALFVDPGIRDCGVAYYIDGELRAAALLKNPVRSGADYDTCRQMAYVVSTWRACGYLNGDAEVIGIEWPRIYTVGKQIVRDANGNARATDPNDLLPLVGVGAAIGALFPVAKVVRYYPDDWKRQVPKVAMNIRVMGRLTPEERKRVEAPDPDPDKPKHWSHNVWDAVGIGLYHLERLERVRVYAR